MAQKSVDQYKRRILLLLLKKYERSQSFQAGIPGKQRPQMTIKGSELAKDYDDEMDYRKRELIHNALQELCHEGITEVTWPKHKENIEVGKVYLNFAGVERAYLYTGEKPKGDKIRQLAELLIPLADHPWDWVRTWGEETCRKLEERRPSGLDLDDQQGYGDLVQVLLALPGLEENTPKRVLSQKLFQDSKRFEQGVERRLLSLLRKIYPEELEKDDDYLDQVGIVENPKLTLVFGSLEIEMPAESAGNSTTGEDRAKSVGFNLRAFPGGLGLSAESIKELSIQDIPARTILLVENLTTYHEVIRHSVQLSPPLLVIYTGGFPHKSAQRLLKKISTFMGTKSPLSLEGIYHWGDIDYGGIRIFEYLKENFFSSLRPYRMDVMTYLDYVTTGLSFGEEQCLKLEQLLTLPGYETWYPVIRELLRHRKRVEQESIR